MYYKLNGDNSLQAIRKFVYWPQYHPDPTEAAQSCRFFHFGMSKNYHAIKRLSKELWNINIVLSHMKSNNLFEWDRIFLKC